jgi:hypothetical protein
MLILDLKEQDCRFQLMDDVLKIVRSQNGTGWEWVNDLPLRLLPMTCYVPVQVDPKSIHWCRIDQRTAQETCCIASGVVVVIG